MSENVSLLYCECDRIDKKPNPPKLWKCSAHGKTGEIIIHVMFDQYRKSMEMDWEEFWDFSNEFYQTKLKEYTFQGVSVYDDTKFFEELRDQCRVWGEFLEVERMRKRIEEEEIRYKGTPKKTSALLRVAYERCYGDDNHSLSRWQRLWYTIKACICIIAGWRKDLSKAKDTIEVASTVEARITGYWVVVFVSKTSWHFDYENRDYHY